MGGLLGAFRVGFAAPFAEVAPCHTHTHTHTNTHRHAPARAKTRASTWAKERGKADGSEAMLSALRPVNIGEPMRRRLGSGRCISQCPHASAATAGAGQPQEAPTTFTISNLIGPITSNKPLRRSSKDDVKRLFKEKVTAKMYTYSCVILKNQKTAQQDLHVCENKVYRRPILIQGCTMMASERIRLFISGSIIFLSKSCREASSFVWNRFGITSPFSIWRLM